MAILWWESSSGYIYTYTLWLFNIAEILSDTKLHRQRYRQKIVPSGYLTLPWYSWPIEIEVYLLIAWWFSLANCECHNQMVYICRSLVTDDQTIPRIWAMASFDHVTYTNGALLSRKKRLMMYNHQLQWNIGVSSRQCWEKNELASYPSICFSAKLGMKPAKIGIF